MTLRSLLLSLTLTAALLGPPLSARAQSDGANRLSATLFIDVDARMRADEIAELAIEAFGPLFDSVTADPDARATADLVGRLELWRYGNVPGAGWTCIADITLGISAAGGTPLFRETGRGCGATKLRKGLFEAALADLSQQISQSIALHDFVATGALPAIPPPSRPPRLEQTIELTPDLLQGNVTWDLALDPTVPRKATVMISDTRRRSGALTQIEILGDELTVTRNPAGLPLGDPVSLISSADGELFARIDDQQYRLDGEVWVEAPGFAPCYESIAPEANGYCSLVVRGSVVDSPRRWRVEVIGGSGIGAAAVLPIPMLYRAPKIVIGRAPFIDAPYFVVIDRETATDFSPDFGSVASAQPGWSYRPWQMTFDAHGIGYVVAKASRPDELRFARIDFPSLIETHGEATATSSLDDDDPRLRDIIEDRTIVDVASVLVDDDCRICNFRMAVDPDTGTTMILSREARETWNATFIAGDESIVTQSLPDLVWPLDVLPAGDDRYYVLGYLPIALIGSPGRLGIYSIAADEPIAHEVTLTLNAWALLPPIAFELDPNSGSILTVWREGREGLRAAWYDPAAAVQ